MVSWADPQNKFKGHPTGPVYYGISMKPCADPFFSFACDFIFGGVQTGR